MITLAALLSWFIAGASWCWIACQWRQQRRDAAHVCRTTLHVHHCRFIDCDPDTLVTYNEETGLSEITGYVVIPKSVWDARYAGAWEDA